MMSGQRPSLFAADDDLDLSQFAPKSEPDAPPVAPETVQRVSEENGFPSRAPKSRAVGAAAAA